VRVAWQHRQLQDCEEQPSGLSPTLLLATLIQTQRCDDSQVRKLMIHRRHQGSVFVRTSTLSYFLAAHVEKWPWRPKSRHGFHMAGEKFDMPSGTGTLFARAFKLQPAQTGRVMSSCCKKTPSRSTARARSSETNVQKFDMILAEFDIPLTSKTTKQNLGITIRLFTFPQLHKPRCIIGWPWVQGFLLRPNRRLRRQLRRHQPSFEASLPTRASPLDDGPKG
jgi:hypothetical protein